MMRGLYAIADVSALGARGIELLPFARAVLAARPAALQLRAKDLPPREMLALLRALHPLCKQARVPLVANDRADVAALGGCDLVHVGQADMPIELVRRLAPHLGVGVSTHTPEQLARALATKPAYVAYGPVFATASKVNPDPVVGTVALRAAHIVARGAGIPLVAIGGITPERASDVARSADAGAVIGALLPVSGNANIDFEEVTLRARALHHALGGGDSASAEVLG